MATEIKIEIAPQKLFTKKAIVVVNAYGFFAIIPLLVAITLSILADKLCYGGLSFILNMLFLGLAAVLPLYFFPLVMGNPHVTYLVGPLNISNKSGFVVQLTNLPRAKAGFWAFMEDADDIGFLSFEADTLIFNGDSTKFSIPLRLIKNVGKKNIGWRGLWICGNRIMIEVSDKSFEFVERFSLSFPGSRKISEEIFNRLSAEIQK